jgi:hypothetical protein
MHPARLIPKDNDKSVVAAQNMKEALERIDSAASFFLWAVKKTRSGNLSEFPDLIGQYTIGARQARHGIRDAVTSVRHHRGCRRRRTHRHRCFGLRAAWLR